MKRALRALAVAVKLRGLRMQQHGQRVLLRQTFGDIGVAARGEMVAGADRKQALRDGVPPLRLTALASKSAETFGSAQETADDGPDQHRGEDNHQQRQHQHRQRGVDAPHAP